MKVVAWMIVAGVALPSFANAQGVTLKADETAHISLPLLGASTAAGMVEDARLLSDGRIVTVVRSNPYQGRKVPPFELRFYAAGTRSTKEVAPLRKLPVTMQQVQQLDVLPGDRVSIYGDGSVLIVNPQGVPLTTHLVSTFTGRRNLPIVGVEAEATLATERLVGDGNVLGYYSNLRGGMTDGVRQYMLTQGSRTVHLLNIADMPMKGMPDGTGHYRAINAVLFGGRPVVGVAGSTIYIGNTSSPEIHAFATDGRTLPSIHLARTARAVTRADADDLRARAINRIRAAYAGSKDPRANAQMATAIADIDSIPSMKTMPLYGNLVASSDGGVWLSDFDTDPSATVRWTKLDASGRETAYVLLPNMFIPTAMSDTRAVGVTRNGTDQSISVYRFSGAK